MTHPPQYLLTILDRPGDDSPRLLYADWLESVGNPLGEFIRLQCVLAQYPVCEPHLFYERRAQSLLARFHSMWSEDLADHVEWCSFRRGFVEEISLTDQQFIKHAKELFRLAPVLDIHLTSDGRRLADLPELPDINHTVFIDLSSQRLGDERIEDLADAPLLAHAHGLNLGSSMLGDDGLDCFFDSRHLGNLRELYLNDNPITDDGIRQLVMSPLAEQLDCLDVRFTRISNEGVDILTHVLGDKVLHNHSAA
jgi:uncharacterized protein (TIGR02996 family)